MDLNALLRSEGGIDAIAGQLGIPRDQAERGVTALLPSIVGGFGHNVQHEGGGGSILGGLLESLGGGRLTDNVVGPEPTRVDDGNAILGTIFGSKDVSRTVAADASQASGLDPALLKKMLPILAMLVGGYLSSRSRGGASGGLGGVLGQVLGQMGGGGAGGLGGVLGSILGGGRGR
ncbi:MAG: DUF937 domain-containing protein [Novosphingobium sp.]